MFRSFAYARNAARQRCSIESSEDCARWDGLMIRWEQETRQAFLEVYDPSPDRTDCMPRSPRRNR